MNREDCCITWHARQAQWEFQLPAGLFIDREDRIFVVDSLNRRVQVYRYHGLPKQAKAGQP